jgi:CHASE3 domain sensor protein
MAEDHTVDRTVIVETPGRSSGSGWAIALVLITALIIAVVFFTQMAGSERAKDNAITNAAQDVGQAARSVGTAAQDAAASAKQAADPES